MTRKYLKIFKRVIIASTIKHSQAIYITHMTGRAQEPEDRITTERSDTNNDKQLSNNERGTMAEA